jgi:hypothetical protein
MRTGQNFTDDEGSIAHDGSLHALENISLKILNLDLYQVHKRRVTRFILVEPHGFYLNPGRALSGLRTLASYFPSQK